MDIQALLKAAVEQGASDLHLSSGVKPMWRIDGDLLAVPDSEIISDRALRQQLETIRPKQGSSAFEQDFSFEIKKLSRFRVNIFEQSRGISAAFRTIPSVVPELESLSMPPILAELCKLPHGLVLVTGPTGSGKSTTLAAMIRHINESQAKHILTLEDPIEYVHQPDQSLIQQREIHQHTDSFQDALRSSLREDPDVLLVGEMRDLETIRLALRAAETGHLVLATLHTSSAASTINRIIDVFPAGEKELVRSMLAQSLDAVISQVLVKRKGGGRVAACEIMTGTSGVANLIRENKVEQIQSMLQTGGESGMNTLEQALEKLQAQGLIESADPDA